MKRTYFDHAATSWPRLPGVVEAMADFEREASAAAGRGSHTSSVSASAKVEQLRLAIASLVRADAEEVAFFANGTLANNYALAGILQPGDHVITTQAEHNSILRPLQLLHKERGIEWTAVPVDSSGRVDPASLKAAIQKNTTWIVCSSASNVTGAIQDLALIGHFAKEHHLKFMVDAAQTLGYCPIDMQAAHIDVLASPGHKGAGGPLGTGLLVANKSLHPSWKPLWIGGTGDFSDLIEGDFAWQQVAESGNRNVAALVGWLTGIERLKQWTHSEYSLQFEAMVARMRDLLHEAPCGKLIGHHDTNYAPVFSLDCKQTQLQPSDWSAILDSSFHVEVRSGFHCAAMIHDALGTKASGGTLRFSIGHTTTPSDLDTLELALEELRRLGASQ